MNLQLLVTLETIARISAVLAIVQSIEFLKMSSAITRIWRWDDIDEYIGGRNIAVRRLVGLFLSDRGFIWLNIARIGLSIGLFVSPGWPWLVALLVLHILTLLRWFGSYNGGSDHMHLFVLWTLSLAFASPEKAGIFCLWLIALQSVASYFRAGWAKFKSPSWRAGTAVFSFASSHRYQTDPGLLSILNSKFGGKFIAWSTILFEMSFPICFWGTKIATAYLLAGFLFHIANAYLFGLNRFVIAWVATYPAIYFCASQRAL